EPRQDPWILHGGDSMRHRFDTFFASAIVMTAVLSLTGTSLAGQTASSADRQTKAAAPAFTASRTPEGQPDLQGVWSFGVGIPLERPGKFGERQAIAEETGE